MNDPHNIVRKEIRAADGGNYGLRVESYDPETKNYWVQAIRWTDSLIIENRDPKYCHINEFKISYRYDLKSARPARKVMPSYKTHDPKGWCGDPRRGAPQGRDSYHCDKPKEFNGRLVLRHVRLNQNGYDQNGTYFGNRQNGNVKYSDVYWYASRDGKIDAILRAPNRLAAKNKIRLKYPNAKFYN